MKQLFSNIKIYFMIFILSFIFSTFILGSGKINGCSMSPTFHDNDFVLLDKFSYHFAELQAGDIIFFKKNNMDKILVKRIVGIPGDDICIKDGYLYVNGEKKFNTFGKMSYGLEFGYNKERIIHLKKNEYFVLGDNRCNSLDSRCEEVGNVKKEEIKGKVLKKME